MLKKIEGEAALMTVKEFVLACKDNYFIDDDGYGFLATETHYEDTRKVFPSDACKWPTTAGPQFTHILWCNK